jgi:hypothetical protein
MSLENKTESILKHSCKNCGAEIKYKAGSTDLQCEYCDHRQSIEIKDDENGIEELDLYKYLSTMGIHSHEQEIISMVECKACGAHQHIEANMKSLSCAFCASPLETKDQQSEVWIYPGAILPFQLNQQKAKQIFHSWAAGRWFAPNKFKKATLQTDYIKGVYTPFWTFDAQMKVSYSGQRGEYYYETESYTVNVNGKSERRTRQVRKTHWYPASGVVSGFVDDTLVNASTKAKREFPNKITNWNLQKLQPFKREFLAGFITEKYTISLKDGHQSALDKAEGIAHNWARQDIGGDTQQVNRLDKELTEETFKHILLPVYISSYRYSGKVYSIYVNGENGIIYGERPYSFWKIFFAVLAGLALIGIIVGMSQ